MRSDGRPTMVPSGRRGRPPAASYPWEAFMVDELAVLNRIHVASPCSATWEEMEGDERARFCSHCRQHVYDLSAMTASEAVRLLEEKEGRLCAAFYRRRDGTVLTRDCDPGRHQTRRALLRGACALGVLVDPFAWVKKLRMKEWPCWKVEPWKSLAVRLKLFEEEPPRVRFMGSVGTTY